MRQLQKIDYSHFVIPLVKDPTEIHVLGVSSDKCSPVKSRGWYEGSFNQNVAIHAFFT